MKRIAVLAIAVAIAGCGESPAPDRAAVDTGSEEAGARPEMQPESLPATASPEARLDAVLEEQPEEVKARYPYRHPKETLTFLGIEPGMTVVEALPGTGWYSRILIPYLGKEGHLVGANYADEVWPLFGFFDDETIQRMTTWAEDWPEEAEAWFGDAGAKVDAFEFGSMPVALEGQADAVLFIRALHNLARFEGEGGYLTTALEETHRLLKPGGIVGVVQHEARPDATDDWASGSNGYLKKQFVIDRFSEAGFEFVDESDVNQNPNDRPGEEDTVWRLPPTLMTSQDDPELRSEMESIGESNRMTLRFRKPEEDEDEAEQADEPQET